MLWAADAAAAEEEAKRAAQTASARISTPETEGIHVVYRYAPTNAWFAPTAIWRGEYDAPEFGGPQGVVWIGPVDFAMSAEWLRAAKVIRALRPGNRIGDFGSSRKC